MGWQEDLGQAAQALFDLSRSVESGPGGGLGSVAYELSLISESMSEIATSMRDQRDQAELNHAIRLAVARATVSSPWHRFGVSEVVAAEATIEACEVWDAEH